MSQDNNSWEQNTIKDMLEMTVKEQRARRRWGIFFKLIILGYLLLVTAVVMIDKVDLKPSKDITVVIPILGEIFAESNSGSENIIPLLRKAFKHTTKAVILRINSPGGSPVQANYIYAEIKRLRVKYPDKKIYAVIEDLGASAAYWIACGADEIYADEASILGSIGVAMSSFGFVDTMQKFGVERRLYIAGNNKDMLDPFSPTKPHQIAMLQTDLDLLHDAFIKLVQTTRGDRLKVSSDMFSGRVWLGLESKELGLIDGFGDQYTVAETIGVPELVEYEVEKSLLTRLGNRFGGSLRQLFSGFKLS